MKEKMIKRICEIYKTMTYDGHKPEEGLEKARCMSAAFHELEDEMNKRSLKWKKRKNTPVTAILSLFVCFLIHTRW